MRTTPGKLDDPRGASFDRPSVRLHSCEYRTIKQTSKYSLRRNNYRQPVKRAPTDSCCRWSAPSFQTTGTGANSTTVSRRAPKSGHFLSAANPHSSICLKGQSADLISPLGGTRGTRTSGNECPESVSFSFNPRVTNDPAR